MTFQEFLDYCLQNPLSHDVFDLTPYELGVFLLALQVIGVQFRDMSDQDIDDLAQIVAGLYEKL